MTDTKHPTTTSNVTSPPQEVIDLVIAAREFWDDNNDLSPESRSLDKALEAFSERVPYQNQPSGSAKWGTDFPPSCCTAWEDCAHDGSCHDREQCQTIGPNDPEPEYDTSRNVSQEEIEQWAALRADDAGYLARKLIALQRSIVDRDMFIHPAPAPQVMGSENALRGPVDKSNNGENDATSP